jgi:hypothetical protein
MFVYTEKNKDSWSGYYGSKPDLKMHIRRIFNVYRATESLIFAVRAEVEALSRLELTEERLAANFNQKLSLMPSFLEGQQKHLHMVRKDISILLHHDAITGTSSPRAE